MSQRNYLLLFQINVRVHLQRLFPFVFVWVSPRDLMSHCENRTCLPIVLVGTEVLLSRQHNACSNENWWFVPETDVFVFWLFVRCKISMWTDLANSFKPRTIVGLPMHCVHSILPKTTSETDTVHKSFVCYCPPLGKSIFFQVLSVSSFAVPPMIRVLQELSLLTKNCFKFTPIEPDTMLAGWSPRRADYQNMPLGKKYWHFWHTGLQTPIAYKCVREEHWREMGVCRGGGG